RTRAGSRRLRTDDPRPTAIRLRLHGRRPTGRSMRGISRGPFHCTTRTEPALRFHTWSGPSRRRDGRVEGRPDRVLARSAGPGASPPRRRPRGPAIGGGWAWRVATSLQWKRMRGPIITEETLARETPKRPRERGPAGPSRAPPRSGPARSSQGEGGRAGRPAGTRASAPT